MRPQVQILLAPQQPDGWSDARQVHWTCRASAFAGGAGSVGARCVGARGREGLGRGSAGCRVLGPWGCWFAGSSGPWLSAVGCRAPGAGRRAAGFADLCWFCWFCVRCGPPPLVHARARGSARPCGWGHVRWARLWGQWLVAWGEGAAAVGRAWVTERGWEGGRAPFRRSPSVVSAVGQAGVRGRRLVVVVPLPRAVASCWSCCAVLLCGFCCVVRVVRVALFLLGRYCRPLVLSVAGGRSLVACCCGAADVCRRGRGAGAEVFSVFCGCFPWTAECVTGGASGDAVPCGAECVVVGRSAGVGVGGGVVRGGRVVRGGAVRPARGTAWGPGVRRLGLGRGAVSPGVGCRVRRLSCPASAECAACRVRRGAGASWGRLGSVRVAAGCDGALYGAYGG